MSIVYARVSTAWQLKPYFRTTQLAEIINHSISRSDGSCLLVALTAAISLAVHIGITFPRPSSKKSGTKPQSGHKTSWLLWRHTFTLYVTTPGTDLQNSVPRRCRRSVDSIDSNLDGHAAFPASQSSSRPSVAPRWLSRIHRLSVIELQFLLLWELMSFSREWHVFLMRRIIHPIMIAFFRLRTKRRRCINLKKSANFDW